MGGGACSPPKILIFKFHKIAFLTSLVGLYWEFSCKRNNKLSHSDLKVQAIYWGSFQAMDTFFGPYFHICLEPALET